MELSAAIPVLILCTVLLWRTWWEARGDDTQRRRRRMRDLEHRMLIGMGAEDMLRRMLIADLRQIRDQRRAIEFLRERYGMDIEWPPRILQAPTLFSVLTGRFTRGRSSSG